MDKITRDIYICRDALAQPIRYVAGTNAIPIELKFRDWTIPSSGTAAIYLTKPSGLLVYDAAEIDADTNTVTITPTTQLFAESGSQWGQVQIVDGDTIAATFRLLFLVGENMVDSEAIKSTNEYTALEALIAQAQQVVSNTTDAIAALQQTVAGNTDDITALASEVGYYGTCATAAATAAKTVTVADSFALTAGATVRVKFTYANTASAPTLNVNGTGAVAIMMYGTMTMTTYRWRPNAVVEFTYDGTNWISHQPGEATATYYGVTKLEDSVESTSTSTAATPNAVKVAYDAAVAAQETADANAEDISELNSKIDRDALLEYICDSGVSSRNGIFRGADLTDVYTVAELHTKVSGGDFSNLYIGDYITVSITTSYGGTESVDLVIAAFDYFYGCGDNSGGLTTHHIVLVPKENFATLAAMNSSATTEGGYSGSDMHTTVLPVYYTALNSALSSHILTHRRYLTTVVSTSAASAGGAGLTGSATNAAWADTNLCLMSEAMVYGGAVFSSSGRDIADACIQLPLFKLRPDYRMATQGKSSSGRFTSWLCGVASSATFCGCASSGNASYYSASTSDGVRPYFLFS